MTTHYSTLIQRCRSTNSLLADQISDEFARIEADNVRLRIIEAAARALIANSPIGDDDKPYCSDVAQTEFAALAATLK